MLLGRLGVVLGVPFVPGVGVLVWPGLVLPADGAGDGRPADEVRATEVATQAGFVLAQPAAATARPAITARPARFLARTNVPTIL
jgi:hypothetical protein